MGLISWLWRSGSICFTSFWRQHDRGRGQWLWLLNPFVNFLPNIFDTLKEIFFLFNSLRCLLACLLQDVAGNTNIYFWTFQLPAGVKIFLRWRHPQCSFSVSIELPASLPWLLRFLPLYVLWWNALCNKVYSLFAFAGLPSSNLTLDRGLSNFILCKVFGLTLSLSRQLKTNLDIIDVINSKRFKSYIASSTQVILSKYHQYVLNQSIPKYISL